MIVTELGEMANGSQRSGLATQDTQELSSRGERFVGWLDAHRATRRPDEIRRYASRNPGRFLAVAAGAGLLVGGSLEAFGTRTPTNDSNASRRWYESHVCRFGLRGTVHRVRLTAQQAAEQRVAATPAPRVSPERPDSPAAAGLPETGSLGAAGGDYPGTSRAALVIPSGHHLRESYRPGARADVRGSSSATASSPIRVIADYRSLRQHRPLGCSAELSDKWVTRHDSPSCPGRSVDRQLAATNDPLGRSSRT